MPDPYSSPEHTLLPALKHKSAAANFEPTKEMQSEALAAARLTAALPEVDCGEHPFIGLHTKAIVARQGRLLRFDGDNECEEFVERLTKVTDEHLQLLNILDETKAWIRNERALRCLTSS